MPARDDVIASTTDPDGRVVVFLARIWHEKVVHDHPEMAPFLEAATATVHEPEHVEADPRDDRLRFYRSQVGPSRWLLVVVGYEQKPSARHNRARHQEGPTVVERVNITIGPVVFDHADYDADVDVLYLHAGYPQPAEGEETPEGHVLRYAPGTQTIVGLTVINARWRLQRDGQLTVTIPERVSASAESLAPALVPS